jgi:adenine phosphoribosyltransferase
LTHDTAKLAPLILDVPDFPKPGIVFKDFTPLLADRGGLALAVACMADPFRERAVDLVMGAESRGFIFGTAIAQALGCGFVPVRKPGKLPRKTHRVTYELEYGSDTLEAHIDAVVKGQRVLLVDDLLATGGTLEACGTLARRFHATIVGITVLIELTALKGRQRLAPFGDVHSVLTY